MRKSLSAIFLASIAVLVGAAVCHAGISRSNLHAKQWSVEKVVAKTELATKSAFISFEPNGKLSGTGGCNRLVGFYEYNPSDHQLTIRKLGRTRKLCARSLMRQEHQIMKALKAASELKEISGERLVVIDKNGAELMYLK